MDARSLPLEIQAEAYQPGFIPCIPAPGPDGTAAAMPLGWPLRTRGHDIEGFPEAFPGQAVLCHR
jgi:hypothetical protein